MGSFSIIVDGPVGLEECTTLDRIFNPLQEYSVSILHKWDCKSLKGDSKCIAVVLQSLPNDVGALMQQLYSQAPSSCKVVVLLASYQSNEVEQLLQQMKVAGLTDARQNSSAHVTAHRLFASYACLEATKPAFQQGAKAKISFGKKGKPGQATPATNGGAGAWKLTTATGGDLMDDDDLLDEDMGQQPAAPLGCGPGGPAPKKVCKDCTCGAAEGKMQPLTQEMLDNPQSNCGSCGLGDAFRCGNCPYRGLPAFEMGKKIQLPDDFLVEDLAG